METTCFSETCNRLHGVTYQSLFQNVGNTYRPTRRRVTWAYIWHRFVLRRLNVNKTFVLEVGVSTASAVCRYSFCRLHRSFFTLCHCARAFVCLQLAALSKFIFNIPYYLDVQKQTFTLPDFASDKTATIFWPRKEGRNCLTHFAAICLLLRGLLHFIVE